MQIEEAPASAIPQARLAVRLSYLALLMPLVSLLTSCSPGIPSELQGRWIQNLDQNVDQVFVFSANSVEFDFIDHGSITSTWTEEFTNVLVSANGVNIIETSGPPAFAWYVSGATLYLDWVNSDEKAQLELLPSDWWQSDPEPTWTRY